ncbi:hypothetical protein V1512DRAFT_266731 [Lipomyces arxii]|uniref:uncharacterized protein n=1 Tax=Lipomyces arxii TaxID=56418 RepID=UPI0034CEB912
MASFFSARRRLLVLKIILRSWYIFISVLISTGALHRLYILPNFFKLVQARAELITYSIDFVARMNGQLFKITRQPVPALENDTTDAQHMNAQTQTDDSSSSSIPASLEASTSESADKEDKDLPRSYHLLRHASRGANVIPGLLVTPGLSSANYIANDLNLLVENMNFSTITGGVKNSNDSSVFVQSKQLANSLKEEIRSLKSLALHYT